MVWGSPAGARQAARVARRVVVISAKHRFWPKKGQSFNQKWHCFAHDYRAICRDLGLACSPCAVFVERPDSGAYGLSSRAMPQTCSDHSA